MGSLAHAASGQPARREHDTATVKSAEAARSSRSKLHSLTVADAADPGTPRLPLRHRPGARGLQAARGPEAALPRRSRPSARHEPPAELPTYLGEAVAWFGHYLVGIEPLGGGLELASDPWDGTVTSYKAPPPTRHTTVNLPGTKGIAANGTVRRSVRLTGGPLETFGDSFVSVRYSGNTGALTAIRAMVSEKGSSTPITVGAAKLGKRAGVVKIPLLDEAVLLPARQEARRDARLDARQTASTSRCSAARAGRR